MQLLHRTIKQLWIEFKNLERPFLVADGRRAEKIRKGDYWGDSDVEEKAGARADGRLEIFACREATSGKVANVM